MQPSHLTRWLTHPVAALQRSSIRATHLPRTQTSTILTRQPLLSSPVAPGGARRFQSKTTRPGSRFQLRCRPGVRPVQLPKQKHSRRCNSGSSGNSSQASNEGGSLSQRLRKLSREYGWAAVGVYFGLSAFDFPFCFAAVRLLGVDRIGHFEHVVVQTFKDALHTVWPQKEPTTPGQGPDEAADKQGRLAQAESRNQEEASASSQLPHSRSALNSHIIDLGIWTQLALAYAIHKSFIFIRVPLTAAVTPKVVKTLRRWGWNIGKRKPKGSP